MKHIRVRSAVDIGTTTALDDALLPVAIISTAGCSLYSPTSRSSKIRYEAACIDGTHDVISSKTTSQPS